MSILILIVVRTLLLIVDTIPPIVLGHQKNANEGLYDDEWARLDELKLVGDSYILERYHNAPYVHVAYALGTEGFMAFCVLAIPSQPFTSSHFGGRQSR
jgi:hypothetical protein